MGWMIYEILNSYPSGNLKEVAKRMFIPIKEIQSVAEILMGWSWIEPQGKYKYRILLSYDSVERIKAALEPKIMRPWRVEDCDTFYHDLSKEERRIFNRLVFSSGKVRAHTLIGILGGKGFFKIVSLERKVRNFCYDRGLAIPFKRIKKFVMGSTTQSEYIVDETFRTTMQKVIGK